MATRFYKQPKLDHPVLIAGWPGIGSIGILAVDTLRRVLGAEEFAEIESWEFFYPRKAIIREGELADLEFPANKFFSARTAVTDIIFFVGEEQPSVGRGAYGQGKRAYQLANMVLDVAQELGCTRVYTSGAASAPIHHTFRPRVWAVPNDTSLIEQVRALPNTILMSDIEGRGGQGNITGLNGLLLGVAHERGIKGICAMGEVPSYLQEIPFPYPKGSRAVLEVFASILQTTVDLSGLDSLIERSDKEIERLYEAFPPEVREQLDKLKEVSRPTPSGPITDEDKKRILEDIDRLFKRKTKED